MKAYMRQYKPWVPRIRTEPFFNSFRSSTDWTRDIGANDRIEIECDRVEFEVDHCEREQEKDAA